MTEVLRRPPWWVVIVGALLALGQLVRTVPEYSAAQKWPHERVTAVSAERHQPVRGCGKGSGVSQDVSWRSANPPQHLLATFRTKDVCYFAQGDSTVALRQLAEDGSVEKVWIDPATSVWTVVRWMMLGFLPAALFYGFVIARFLGRKYVWHD